jgi:hypothetical protein
VDPVELALEDSLLRLDNGIVEVFKRSYDKSLRVPAAWVGVETHPEKHDRLQVRIGTASPIGPVVYGEGVSVLGGYWPIEVDAVDEPQVRGFFEQVASASGRQVG